MTATAESAGNRHDMNFMRPEDYNVADDTFKFDPYVISAKEEENIDQESDQTQERLEFSISKTLVDIDKLISTFKTQISEVFDNAINLISKMGTWEKIKYLIYQDPCIYTANSSDKNPKTKRTLFKSNFREIEEETGLLKRLEAIRMHFNNLIILNEQAEIFSKNESLKSLLLRDFDKKTEKQNYLTRSIMEKIRKRAICIQKGIES